MRFENKKYKLPFHLGYTCNFKCKFCYFGKSLTHGDYSTKRIKNTLSLFGKLGFDWVDFLGGEPTIRPDFHELVAYAKKSGFKRIATVTNGYRLGDEKFFKKSIETGLNEITFSLLGVNDKTHDRLSQTNDSHQNMMNAINHCINEDVAYNIHYIVLNDNYKEIPEAMREYVKLKPERIEFLYYCPGFDINIDTFQTLVPKYSDVSPYLKKGLDILEENKVYTKILDTPYCIIPEQEKNYTNNFKFPEYTEDEGYWMLKESILKNPLDPIHKVLMGLSHIEKEDLKLDLFSLLRKTHLRGLIRKTHQKPGSCKKCRLSNICCGIWDE